MQPFHFQLFNLLCTETCSDEAFDCNTDDMPSNLRYYIWVFIAAQLLHGFGATPLYTLGISYIEDSVPKKSSPLYFGITLRNEFGCVAATFNALFLCMRAIELQT